MYCMAKAGKGGILNYPEMKGRREYAVKPPGSSGELKRKFREVHLTKILSS